MKEFSVTKEYDGIRIDRYCEKILPAASKSFIYKMFRKKNIMLNGSKIKGVEKVKQDDCVIFYLSNDTFSKFHTKETVIIVSSLDENLIIYEDSNVLVYNKPVDMLSQPNGKDKNLYDAVFKYLGTPLDNMSPKSIGVCNRLDRNTTGVSIIGKNAIALRNINQSIATHQTAKIYHAIVIGKITKPMTIKGYLNKDSKLNKVTISEHQKSNDDVFIHTEINPIHYNNQVDLTYIEVVLITGKTHQIRAHLSSIQHGILGDYKYGNPIINVQYKNKYQVTHQLLHAYSYTLKGLGQELSAINNKTFIAKHPNVFEKLLLLFFTDE